MEQNSWDFDDYTVVFEPPQNVILHSNAATIAITGVSSVDPTALIAELWEFVDEYTEQHNLDLDSAPGLLNDNRMEFGKFFVVSCSSLDLAYYICSKTPIVGTPYELVYELNGRGLVPAERARSWNYDGVNRCKTVETAPLGWLVRW